MKKLLVLLALLPVLACSVDSDTDEFEPDNNTQPPAEATEGESVEIQ